jgi:uncharacterized protein
MWMVELSFTPEPDRLAARPAHRSRLVELHQVGTVRMAGPLADDSGAMIIFDVADRAALQQLLDADPYYSTPGVSIAHVREWKPFLG